MKLYIGFLLILLAIPMIGASPVSGQATAKVTANNALLYEITGKKLKKPSYLFGTIHLICRNDMFTDEKLKAYFGTTEQLLLEFDMDDPAAIQKAVQYSMLPGGKTIKEYMTPAEYSRLDGLYKEYVGISFDHLQTYKPMISGAYLLTSQKVIGCQPPMVYDKYLSDAAVLARIPVIGLESAEAQIAVIDSQTIEQQMKELKETSVNPQKAINDFHVLYKTYLTQDADALYRLTESEFKKGGYSQPKMLDQRNANWIPLIEQHIAEKPSFVGVGAGHLGGPGGVINLLRSKGYTLRPIRL